ncbi:KxDL motif-containing protein 1 [Coemansia javaensis]|uniref:KxDL motif-containing protein 1 n=1 Tax=Coemansia javaensis TaxID=2761396 RepID=A0A9W8H4R5_9FUNG|nr:KxDL motif-containing protein 1 [Coemansia javaensis]
MDAGTTENAEATASTPPPGAIPGPMPGLPVLDVTKVLKSQGEQLDIYRRLLETLAESEQESAALLPELSKSLAAHTGTLSQLKDDLQDVFTRIRALKAHFQKKHPDAFDYVQSLHVKELDDDEDGDDGGTAG